MKPDPKLMFRAATPVEREMLDEIFGGAAAFGKTRKVKLKNPKAIRKERRRRNAS